MVTTTDLPAADQAMMKAVQNAALFAFTPRGPADVDIEFTLTTMFLIVVVAEACITRRITYSFIVENCSKKSFSCFR
jgi:hypothetical protein